MGMRQVSSGGFDSGVGVVEWELDGVGASKKAMDHNIVRIVWQPSEPRAFTGTAGVARTPRIGDVGFIVDFYSQDTCAVKCVNAHGLTLWLADFHLGELEFVESSTDSQVTQIDIEIAFLPIEQGGRERVPELSRNSYRPHIRVPPSTEMLGVQFLGMPYGQLTHAVPISATVCPLYGSNVPYKLLEPGVQIEVVEGSRIVARGHVVRVREGTAAQRSG